ncbi:MAG: Fpg/Nei family DNA glycosylase [Candidatus Halalkalibacterium sp. M3_1C_030]
MPELPEVVYFKKYIDSTSLHQQISEVEVENDTILTGISAGDLRKELEEHQFQSTSTHGKYLFIRTDNDRELVMHFGMTGEPVYYKEPNDKPDYSRATFHFDNGYHLAFNCMRMLGEVGMVESRESFIQEKNLGPDAYSESFDLQTFKKLLKDKRGMIKSALMDQSFIAGIGNECSDEILYQARIYPKTTVADLSEADRELIFEKIQEVIREKIDSNMEHRKLPDTFILSHRKEGAECPKCGGTVQKIKVRGRNGYYCPQCQQR